MTKPMSRWSSAALSRRSFVERLALGAGAVILNPIARGLVSEARGQVQTRRRVMFFLTGNGTNPQTNFTPKEFPAGGDSWTAVMDGPKTYTWPGMVKALEPWRQRMLLIDGLSNRIPRSQHSCGYGALSMMPAAKGTDAEYNGPPGGVTIDQYIAGQIGKDTGFKSVLFGVCRESRIMDARVFAAGVEQPVPAFMGPQTMWSSLFGSLATPTAAGRTKLLLDGINEDVRKLQGSLAASEKRKLEHYLAALEDFEQRQKSLAQLKCALPEQPMDKATVEDLLEAQFDLAIVALTCGMTNVVGVAAAVGNGHGAPDYTRLGVGFEGHSPAEVQGPAQEKIHNFHAGLMARTIQAVSKITEGDRTIFDNMVIVYMNDNAEAHHGAHRRWPLVVIGNAGGKLKADGRFLRYAPGARSMADFFCSVSTAVGAPTDKFGMGGVEPVKGPLPEIMAA